MRVASQKTKLAILMDHVDEWKGRAGSREAVAVAIVEKHIELGANTLPKMQFETSGDSFSRAKNAADRIFRWLDDKTKDGTFMPPNFELSILAAMPVDLRMSCLNEFLAPLALVVRGAEEGAHASLNATMHLVHIVKESAEATAAVAELIQHPTQENLAVADKELSEAEESLRDARADVRRHQAVRVVA